MTNPADKLSLLMATPNEEPVSQYKGVVQQTDDSKACVLIDGGTAVWCDTMDVKALVGDRVRVEVRKHKGTLVANYTHPVTDDAVANEALDKVETLEVDALKADSAVIKNLQADTAKVHNLTADQLSAATAYVGELTAGEVTAQSIIADKAKLAQVDTDQLNADHAVIETLDSTYASIDNLNAATARIGNIEADYLVAADMTAEQARVGQLMAGKADVADLTAANARIDNLQSTKADISVLESDYITADAIDATYLHADMSNADVAWIQNGVIKDGSISNAMINDVSANKLTAGTINGSVINVTNLNADNITAGTINGQRIGEGSLSLDKLSEDVYTEAEVDTIVEGLNDRIDGAIETHTGTTVPTLNNAPASAWNTTALRDEHVGDVYYVVNSQSQQNGYCYRFTKSGSTYSWQLIKDSDVTAALSRLNTAEGKITTFDSDISTLKTDTGTLKTKTESLETRMSDAEDDILDKVDTTTFNEVSDTVDQHSQSITQMSQTLSNKADGSTVTALTTRVSKNEQDITGINTTVGELSTTVESKADGSTVESVSNRLNTVSNTVDGHTQSISSINSTLATKADSSTVSTLTTKVNTISDTVDGHTSQLSSITTTQTSIQGSAVKSTVQLWFTKANTTAPSKPTAHVTTNNASTANAWNLAVPTYNASYPYYYYCYEHQLLNDTYTWSAVTRDIATEESQSTSRSAASAAAAADTKAGNAATAAATADGKAVSAQNTANKNVRESQQLWYTKADSTAPAKPTSKVTSTATTGGAWTTRVPTYSDSYKHYFYCMQYVAADGTVTWSDVIYDQATTEAQSVARAASADLTEFHQEYATFKQTTQQFESTVGETYATKTALQSVDDKIDNLEIGGRNLLGNTENRSGSAIVDNYAAASTFGSIGNYNDAVSLYSLVDYDGYSNAVSCATSTSTGNRGAGWYTKAGEIRAGETYTFSCRIKCSIATNVHMHTAWRNGSATASYTGWSAGGTKDISANTWTDYSCTFVPSSSAKLDWEFFVAICITGSSSGATYQIAHAKLEKGNKATDWTPAPEDLDSHFESVESSIAQTAEGITESVSKNYATKDESQLDRAGSGTSVTVEGAANAALKGLHVLGKSVQDGTPTPSSPVQILSVGPNPVGKTDVWLQGGIDGNTGATDSRTSRIHTELVAVVGGKAYTLAFDEESQYGLEVYQYKADGTYITTSHGWRESPYTIVMNGSTSFVRLLAYDKTSNSITKSAIETFNPRLYHGTYPVPFVEDIGFWVRGRNLLPSDAEFWRQTGIDGSTGNYTENNQQRAASWAVRVMPSTDYTISATSGTRFAVYQYTDEGAYIPVTYGWWTNSRTFTTQAEAAGLRVLISNADDSDVDLNTIADRSLQVEIGTSATPYQPYTESVTPIPLNGHELRSLPDGTQDELTVDVDGHVTMTQRVGSVTLDGSETWTMIAKGSGYSGYSGSYLGYAAAPTEAASPVSGGLVAFCNKYSVPNPARIALYTDNSAAINNSSMSGSKRVFVFDSTLTSSAADFKAVLASSPMELTYPLATPQTIDLGTIDMPRVHDGDTVEVIAALTPSIDATWWASAGQAVADAYASLSSAIEVRAESIVSTVSERYATSQQVQAISSQIEQTAQGWTAQFNELTGGADLSMTLAQAFDALGVTSRNLEEIRSFVRITTDSNGDPLLLMGSATSPIMLALSNDSLRFMHGPDPVAYIDVDGTTNEGRLHITRAVVVKELQFGSWKWFERDGVGNLALKWVGDE